MLNFHLDISRDDYRIETESQKRKRGRFSGQQTIADYNASLQDLSRIRLANKQRVHGAQLGRQMRLCMKLTVTELPKNWPGTQIPTGPTEWRISVHVFGINARIRIEKHLDGCFRAEGRRAVQRRFSLGSAIAHEVIRRNRWLGHAIGIRTIGEQHFEHSVMGLSIGCAESGVQR